MVEKVVYEKDLREMVKDILIVSPGDYYGKGVIHSQTMDVILFKAGLPQRGKVTVV